MIKEEGGTVDEKKSIVGSPFSVSLLPSIFARLMKLSNGHTLEAVHCLVVRYYIWSYPRLQEA